MRVRQADPHFWCRASYPIEARRDSYKIARGLSKLFSQILDNVYEIGCHVLHILVRQPGVQRQCHLVYKQVVGIGVILDVKAQRLIRRHHRQRFIVHVTCDAPLRHFDDDSPPLLVRATQQTSDIQMTAPRVVLPVMIQNRNRQVLQRPTFRRCQVLHRMEAERREVSNLPRHLPVPFCSEGMRIISSNNDTSYLPLDGIPRLEQVLLSLNHLVHLVKVTYDGLKKLLYI